MVSSPVKPMLAVEWLQPGEGEDPAALRLLTRLPELYGSPFVDILLLDSLDAQAPVLKLAAPVGWDLVVSLKQQARELYQNAMGLFTHRAGRSMVHHSPGRETVCGKPVGHRQADIYPRPSATGAGRLVAGNAHPESLPARASAYRKPRNSNGFG